MTRKQCGFISVLTLGLVTLVTPAGAQQQPDSVTITIDLATGVREVLERHRTEVLVREAPPGPPGAPSAGAPTPIHASLEDWLASFIVERVYSILESDPTPELRATIEAVHRAEQAKRDEQRRAVKRRKPGRAQ